MRGCRTIRIRSADVDVWLDADVEPGGDAAEFGDRVRAAHERVDALNELAEELGDETPPPTEISDDPLLAVYHLGSLAPIGPADRYRLLAAPGLDERLDVLDSALDDVEAVLEFRRT